MYCDAWPQLWKTANFSSSFVGMWPAPLAAVPTGWLPGPLGKGGPGLLSVGQAAVSATAFDGTSLWNIRLDYIPPYGLAYVGDFAVSAQVRQRTVRTWLVLWTPRT